MQSIFVYNLIADDNSMLDWLRMVSDNGNHSIRLESVECGESVEAFNQLGSLSG